LPEKRGSSYWHFLCSFCSQWLACTLHGPRSSIVPRIMPRKLQVYDM
jgi:hypothetical protein